MASARQTTPGTNTSWSGTRRSFPTAVRKRIIERDRACVQCGSTDRLEADHVTPHAQAKRLGWTDEQIDSMDNGQTLCHVHHAEKSRGERLLGMRQRRPRQARRHPGLVA